MAEVSTEAEAPLWGVSAEFTTPEAMIGAMEALRGRGLGRLEAYSPVPMLDAASALRLPNEHVFPFALVGTLLGGSLMFTLCVWQTTQEYVFNIGGRPRFSWPYFLVPSFSFATLAGTLAVLFALLVLNRLPRLNHPAFNIPHFSRSTQDRFFLVVEARDEGFDPAAVERALGALSNQPVTVSRVPR
jgi:hypothetical protein